MKTINKWTYRITTKTLRRSTLTFISMLIFINILGVRFASITGEKVLDFSIGYTPNDAYQMVSNYGESGQHFYRNLLLLDTIFPVVYMIFGVCLLGFLLNKYVDKQSKLRILLILPIIGMFFDWMENTMIFLMLNQFPERFDLLAKICVNFTVLKFTFTGLTLLIAVILFVTGHYKFSRK